MPAASAWRPRSPARLPRAIRPAPAAINAHAALHSRKPWAASKASTGSMANSSQRSKRVRKAIATGMPNPTQNTGSRMNTMSP